MPTVPATAAVLSGPTACPAPNRVTRLAQEAMSAPLAAPASAGAAKPAPAPQPLSCAECGQEMPPGKRGGRQKVFCSERCKTANGNRAALRGKALVRLAQAWRVDRGGTDIAKIAFAEMTAMLDQWNAEDREAGRIRADKHVAAMINYSPKNGWFDKHADRKPGRRL